jgi:hypothetical protein
LKTILQRIDEAYKNFPALKLVVFSGGECFLLKDDLFAAISHASSLGLLTRCVSNGYWGKNPKKAEETVKKLNLAGLTEINFSTGLDHQKWVPLASIANACSATINGGIRTALSIEKDDATSACYQSATEHPLIRAVLPSPMFMVQKASWMPFHESASPRSKGNIPALQKGCKQILTNLVVTPHDYLSACCGLTHEHIPELKLGSLEASPMRELFDAQFEDFLKIWIHVDGPHSIIRRLFGDGGEGALANVVHMCQACVILHKNPSVISALRQRYFEFVPEVMARFNLSLALANADLLALTNQRHILLEKRARATPSNSVVLAQESQN